MSATAIDLNLGRHAVMLAKQRWGKDALLPIGPQLSALLPLVPQSDHIRRWHVVQTEPQKEFRVGDDLKRAGFDAWCPKRPCKVRIRAESYRKVDRPLLPGYVLAGFDSDYEPWELIRASQIVHGQRIEGMRGVVRLFKIEMKPVPLGDKEVTRLVEIEAEEAARSRSKTGVVAPPIDALVRVLAGAFVGFMGFVRSVNDHKHECDVELDIFRRMTKATLEWGQVEVV